MKIAYLDCFSGISGDMVIGAFLDAGLSFEVLSRELAKLKVKGYSLKKSKVRRQAISGTKFDCIAASSSHSHRSLKEILSIIDRSSLGLRVKTIAKDIFTNIGKAEAKVHGIKPTEDIRLHELGAIDSLIDIVGVAIAIDELDIGQVYASEVNTGRGFVKTEHGNLPVPAPASMELLKGAPVRMLDGLYAELVTPTGAGMLKSLVKSFGPIPHIDVESVGYGAGSRELAQIPNMLRVIIGQPMEAFKKDRLIVMDTNIDDMNPQNFEYLLEKLFKEGALDAYTTPIHMKKSRPAIKLTVLSDPKDFNRISSAVFSETTTLGIRYYEADRVKLERSFAQVRTRYGDVKVKLGSLGDSVFTASPEYDDCVKLARKKNVPLKAVYDEAKKLVKV